MIYLPLYWAPTSLCIPSCTSEKPTRNSLTLSSHTRFFHVYLPWGHPVDFSSHSRLLIFFPHQTICCSPNFPFMYLSKWFPLLEITSLLSFVWSGNFWSFQNRIQMLPPPRSSPPPNNCRFLLCFPSLCSSEGFSLTYGTIWVRTPAEIKGRLCSLGKLRFSKRILLPLLRGSFRGHRPVPGNWTEFIFAVILPVPALLFSSFLKSDFISR